MKKIDNNYSIKVNNVHGFELHFKGEEVEREMNLKGVVKMVKTAPTDIWYYSNLYLIFRRYHKQINKIVDDEELKRDFSKVFAKNGKIFKLS